MPLNLRMLNASVIVKLAIGKDLVVEIIEHRDRVAPLKNARILKVKSLKVFTLILPLYISIIITG